jgi:enoyl-CoA hydratase
MILSDYKHIRLERRGRILTATLDRADKRNAIDDKLDQELARLFWDVDLDDETNVLVLTGAGSAFSSGGDLEYMRKVAEDLSFFERSMRNGKRILQTMLDCEKPIICRLNGDAIGLGATIALFCDIIIATDAARIGDPHVRAGLVAGDGGALIWPQLVGYARAKQYLLGGDLISARDAQQMGLINFAVPAEELDALTDQWADRLSNGATKALRWTKATMNIGLKQLLASMSDAGFALEAVSTRSADHREAVEAFSAKRKPTFTGR